jgi:anti-sigma regulatory factor (Ser/Thr protein kinase)
MARGSSLQESLPAVVEAPVSKQFTFPGDSESLVASRQAVMDFIQPHASSEVEEMDIFVALQEALANAVLHGCHNDPFKAIHCSVVIHPSAFTITVRDPGPGFDVDAATQAAESGTNTTTRGRGILMMRGLMDEVVYRNGGSEVQMRKLRTVSIC